ncbi:phosphotransferase [Actinomycetospora aeridis]|uniref:Phosphotransferase n=1 Tax=Actinomycetospora aeridis TaxID=3129231 RepID=A0ABU8MYT5_9PSEU
MTRVPLGSGWDSDAVLVDGRRVERTARRPGAAAGLRREAELLPWLADRLPLPVPRPVVVGGSPLVVSHGFLPGTALVALDAEQGAVLGAFLRLLHAVPMDEAVAHGLPAPEITRGWRDAAFDRFVADVLPRLPDPGPLTSRLERLRAAPASTPVHGDLRGDHVLAVGGRITGVIDWSDARAGDPAKDLVWPLLGHGPAVAAAVVEAYGADLTARADDWRAVAPCYAVVHGLDTGDDALVGASLAQLAVA